MTRLKPRIASEARRTNETDVSVTVNVDGDGRASINSGIGFLDHMLVAVARHSHIDIELSCTGDTHIDCHHSAEDCAMVLGRAINNALDDRMGIGVLAMQPFRWTRHWRGPPLT